LQIDKYGFGEQFATGCYAKKCAVVDFVKLRLSSHISSE